MGIMYWLKAFLFRQTESVEFSTDVKLSNALQVWPILYRISEVWSSRPMLTSCPRYLYMCVYSTLSFLIFKDSLLRMKFVVNCVIFFCYVYFQSSLSALLYSVSGISRIVECYLLIR